MPKTVEQINRRIRAGKAVVVTADEMGSLVREQGAKKAAEKVDVVTTGTFGAMCSSGAWVNFGHSEIPIKMQRVWLNDVEAYTGVAAVDAYIGATQLSGSKGMAYGGGHVIEDLIAGKKVRMRATAYGTDCYPRKDIETDLFLKDLNQAFLSNPRNAYQRYMVATNTTGKVLRTYMGKLLPRLGNATYSGAGELSPINNDPSFRTMGIGTRIFLCGGTGYITGSGTAHNPGGGFSTLMVQGDLRGMKKEYIRGATFNGYGCSLYVGIGVPIPVLNEKVAQSAAITDGEIATSVLDYGVQKRDRPVLRKVTYAELKSGSIEINGKDVKTGALSSTFVAKKIALELRKNIENGNFLLTRPAVPIPSEGSSHPMVENRRDVQGGGETGRQCGSETGGRRYQGSRPAAGRRGSKSEAGKDLDEGHLILRDDAACTRCGHCVSLCSQGAHRHRKNGDVSLDGSRCTGCRLCIDACPVGALSGGTGK